MNLLEEAVIIEVFGVKVYAFGLYVMLGAICSMITLALLAKHLGLKPGTAPLTALLSMVIGIIISRLTFCLLNQELGRMTPISFWPQLAGGGWSMFGLIGGIFLGGWISGKIMKEKTAKVLDILSVALLPTVIAERIAENRIEDFDISRPLDSQLFAKSFLAVGEDEPCLATYYVAAAAALVLFVFLLIRITKRRADGDTVIAFLLLFGAGAIVLESLRYDRFLSISFVGLQQIAAAVMLAIGVVIAYVRGRNQKPRLAVAALISLPLMVGIVLGLEFALDRTTWNKILLYAIMILTVAVPAGMGLKLLNKETEGKV
jgi:prolipoprotein diacylglyceryltransferase